MSKSKPQKDISVTDDESVSNNRSFINNTSHVSHPDDDTLIQKTKQNKVSPLLTKPETPAKQEVKKQPQKSDVSIGIDIEENKKLPRREKFAACLTSKGMDWFFIGLIIIYMGLVIVNLVLDNGCVSDLGILNALQILRYVEITILSFFIIEILVKTCALGFKGYFKDCWFILDAVIVLATFGLVIVDICIPGQIQGLSQIRGLFRLFRIFLLYRKATMFTKVTRKMIRTHGYNTKSPAEKVLDLLESLKQYTKEKEILDEIKWAIDMVSSNKLYDVILEREAGDAGGKEVNDWIKSYGTKIADDLNSPDKTKKDAGSEKQPTMNSKLLPATQSLAQEVVAVLDSTALEFSFDVFNFEKLAPKKELASLMYYIYDKMNLFDSLNIDVPAFAKFSMKLQTGYRNNPYHNSLHATDVLQTVAYMTIKCGFKESAGLDNLDLSSILFSAAIHDYDHPGYNNLYHINSQHELAIRYNDKSVLENYHIASSYMLLKDKDLNIFSGLSKADFKSSREKIIALVLATDMSQHFSEIALLKTRLAADFDQKQKDKLLCMKMLVHAADISNPAKSWLTCEEWAKRCLQEFWAQGDLEREQGIPISYLCDRYTTNTSKSQVGFMDIFVQPTWDLISQFLTGLELSHFETNKANWKSREVQYDEELKKLNEEKAEREKRDGILAGQ